jgi:hypothetical protein
MEAYFQFSVFKSGIRLKCRMFPLPDSLSHAALIA